MKKRLTAVALLFSMLLMLFPAPASASDGTPNVWNGTADTVWSGSGAFTDPYLISSGEELAGLAQRVNAGNNYKDKYFKLTADVWLNKNSTSAWTPIGDQSRPFRGNFDGNGHAIYGLLINAEKGEDIGLFGSIGTGGVVSNLGLSGGSVLGKRCVGTVAGYNAGLIQNCWSNGWIYCMREYGGGIVGKNVGAVVDCYNTGDIKDGGNKCDNLGGITGLNDGGIISGCYNTGEIYARYRIGGIAGRVGSSGIVFNSWNTGKVTSKNSEVGGITGHNSPNCIVANCYNTGDIKGKHRVGGVVGYNHGGVTINCYSTGEIRGNSGETGIGAIVGYNDDKAGSGTGFMGGYDVPDKAGYVVNCYWLAGSVVAGGGPKSGVGANDNNCSIIGVGKFTSPNSNIVASDRGRGGSTWLSQAIESVLEKVFEVGIDIACQKLEIKTPESLKNIDINIDSQPAFAGNSTTYTGTLLAALNKGVGADEMGTYGHWYQYEDTNGGYPVLLKKTSPIFFKPPVFDLRPDLRPIDWSLLAPIEEKIEEASREESTTPPIVLNSAYPLDREIETGESAAFSSSLSGEYPDSGSLIREWHVVAGDNDYYLSSDEETKIGGCSFTFENDNLLRVTAGTDAESMIYQVYCDVSNSKSTVRSRVATLTVHGNNTGNMQGDRQGSSASISLTIGDSFMTVNGNRLEIDPGRGTKPMIMGGRTILPIRAVVEALGGSISWNENERKITIARQDTVIEMWVDNKEMLVNGATITNDVPPTIIGARTYVPVRFVAENLNCDVSWDEATRTVTITTR